MQLHDLQYLFLIPCATALAFMFWVLWNMTWELGAQKESALKQPLISISVNDRYASSTFAPMPRRTEVVPGHRKGLRLEIGRATVVNREFRPALSVPTLGAGLTRSSSSRVPGVRN